MNYINKFIFPKRWWFSLIINRFTVFGSVDSFVENDKMHFRKSKMTYTAPKYASYVLYRYLGNI